MNENAKRRCSILGRVFQTRKFRFAPDLGHWSPSAGRLKADLEEHAVDGCAFRSSHVIYRRIQRPGYHCPSLSVTLMHQRARIPSRRPEFSGAGAALLYAPLRDPDGELSALKLGQPLWAVPFPLAGLGRGAIGSLYPRLRPFASLAVERFAALRPRQSSSQK